MAKKAPSKKAPSKKPTAAMLILIAAATNLNAEMGLTGKDLIDLDGNEAGLKKGITNAAKFIEDSDKFDDETWDVLEDLELCVRPTEAVAELKLMVGSKVTVDYDGDDYPGEVTELGKTKSTITFEDGDTDEIANGDITIVSNPAPKKKKPAASKKAPKKKVAAKKEPELPIIEVGTKVTADYDGEDYPGVVTEIDGEDATVEFEDDSTDTLAVDELTFVEAPAKKKPAPAKKKAAKKAPAKKVVEEEPEPEGITAGTRVSADFDGEAYEGAVVEATEDGVVVDFDDGSTETLPEEELTVLEAPKKKKPAAKKAPAEDAPAPKKRTKKETTTGDEVTVDYDGEIYAGVVIAGDTEEGFVVLFEDGTSETVEADGFASVKHLTGVRALKAAAYARYVELGGDDEAEDISAEDISEYLQGSLDEEKIQSWLNDWPRGYNVPSSAK